MVEKFNFYDIYGYLLPGIALCGLIWLPFGLLFHVWPTQELSSALLALVVAYFAGHLLHIFSMNWLLRPTDGDGRFPSARMLDENDPTFTQELKRRIEGLSNQYFDLPLGSVLAVNEMVDSALKAQLIKVKAKQEELEEKPEKKEKLKSAIKQMQDELEKTETRNRRDAFFQARSALLRTGKGFYWEQFEGLYALMCGLSASAAISTPYFLGWAAGCCRKQSSSIFFRDVDLGAIIALGLLLIYLSKLAFHTATVRANGTQQQKAHLRRETGRALLIIALLAGYFLSLAAQPTPPETPRPCAFSLISVTACGGDIKAKSEDTVVAQITHPAVLMFLLALGALVAAIVTHQAFKSFANSFAEYVWRDFANIEAKWIPKPETGNAKI